MGNYGICSSCSTIIIMSKMSSAVTKKLLRHNQLSYHCDSSKAIIKKKTNPVHWSLLKRAELSNSRGGGNDSFTNSQIFSKSPTRRPSIMATVSADTGRGRGGGRRPQCRGDAIVSVMNGARRLYRLRFIYLSITYSWWTPPLSVDNDWKHQVIE